MKYPGVLKYPSSRASRDRSRRTIVCPCHDATLADLRHSWAAGYTHPETLKRATAVFMGPCQGKYCAPLVGQVIAELDGERAGNGSRARRRPTARPPLYPVRLGDLASECDTDPGSADNQAAD